MARNHLYRRKKGGVWYADYTNPAGIRIRFSTRCTDEKAARQVLARRERLDIAQAAAGLSSDSAGKTIEDVTYYLAVECHTSLKGEPIPEGTRAMYTDKGGHLNRLLRVCGGCAVNGDLAAAEACEARHASIELVNLKRADVVRYINNRMAEGPARTMIKKDLNTLSTALKQAANVGWCSHSLAVECIPKFAAKSEPKERWLTEDEFPRLLAGLDTTNQLAKPLRNPDKEAKRLRMLEVRRASIADRQLFVTVACFTGGELSALERLDWTDVHFAATTIRVPGTKHETRDRTIDLDPQLAAALGTVPAARRIGRVLRPWANACKDLDAACKRAGIPRVTPHTFRHTFGSWLVQAGVDTFVVGRLMGHKDSKMVEEFYGHLAPKNRSEAMARLPRFPMVFPAATAPIEPRETCDAGVPNQVAIHGPDDAHGAPAAHLPESKNSSISEEKPLSASEKLGEGRRTRTFNQRIKSPMLYH